MIPPSAGTGSATWPAWCPGLFAGLTIAIIRRLKQSNGSVVIYLYFCAVGAAVTAPFFLQDPALPVSTHQVMVCGGRVITSIFGQLTMNHGFGYCRSWEGGLYMTSEMVFTAIAGIVLLGDPVGWRFWSGGALILGGAVTAQMQRAFPGCQSGR